MMDNFYRKKMEECNVADNLRDGLELYLLRKILPGGFLIACLENNLSEAMGRASTQTWEYVHNVVMFLYNYAPSDSWGSPEKVKKFLKKEVEGESK